ncbi:peptide cleavage/export ABC transporter [Lacticaseibacillus huelsenbergensis]|uniref:Peptide cleavage/export ABC transporter n=3 Tax=Lacticaseibacillus TaxID=2759736 RepID=A0ABY8DT89_9LACO|nr:peptide cleavage/export ABC transporter [Lacticaseibacillus huelsenbergensis]WFB39812.1 peptide cleavage/export ABC transporter [Lacticaseibacillus huelsenbergensis]
MRHVNRCDYVPQADPRESGVAALNMVLKFYGAEISPTRLRALAEVDQTGTTLDDLIHAAEALHFTTKSVISLTPKRLNETPLIVASRDAQAGQQRFAVVFKITKRHLLVADPDVTVGVKWLSYQQFNQTWAAAGAIIKPRLNHTAVKMPSSHLRTIKALILQQKVALVYLILAVLATTGISVAGAFFLQIIVDTYLPNGLMRPLAIMALALMGAGLFEAVLTWGRELLLGMLDQRLMIDVTLAYVRRLYAMPLPFFNRQRQALTAQVAETNRLIGVAAKTLATQWLETLAATILLVLLVVMNWKLALPAVLAIFGDALLMWLFRDRLRAAGYATSQSGVAVSTEITEGLRGVEAMQALRAEPDLFRRVDQAFADDLHKKFAQLQFVQLQRAVQRAFHFILTVDLLWLGASMVVTQQLSLGQLVAFAALFVYFIGHLTQVVRLQPQRQLIAVADSRLRDLPSSSAADQQRRVSDSQQISGTIKLSQVTFGYRQKRSVLQKINLTIMPNHNMAIVGASGAGKTTLARLIDGLWPLDAGSGTITFNQTNINDIRLSLLRQYVAYVPERPVIFSGSILDNLRLGNRFDVTDDDMDAACETAEIADDITNLPNLVYTLVDANTETMTASQKQRLAIARALLSPAKVLIFDGTFSQIENATAERILDRLFAIKDRTIILMTQQPQLARNADKIVVLVNGRIVEQGSYPILFAKHGYYAQMLRR